MRFLMIVVELDIPDSTGPLYLSTHAFTTHPSDAPASRMFEPRLMEDVEFERRVGCVLWGSAARGTQNFGVIRCANADGRFDAYVGTSLRDRPLRILRGYTDETFATFSLVASLIVDRVEFTDELVMAIYVTDIGAKLERSFQLSTYPDTLTNQALRGQPRPVTFGRCHQVPLQKPDAFGNGFYDLHDGDNWLGIDQLIEAGRTQIEGVDYERSTKAGTYGVERFTSVRGKQAANVAGAFKITSTEVSEDFANLTSWTEANGGIAGRDVSVVGNAARILNTAGGAALSITWNASTPTGTAATYWVYAFACTSWTSGYAQLRAGSAIHRKIDAAGRYTGVIRAPGNVVPAFVAPAGSNADLTIDAFRLYKVTLMEGLADCVKFLCTNDPTVGGHGPLTVADLDMTAINALEAAAPYAIAFHADSPVQIADLLDQVLASFGGWWYVNRLGLITVGRLEEPVGAPVATFDGSNVADGVRIEFDAANGLSTRGLGKRNWVQFPFDEVAEVLQFVALNATDRIPNLTVSADALSYTTAAAGSVRSMPAMYGGRLYFEVRITGVGSNQHYVGTAAANVATPINGFAGSATSSIGYRSNGDAYSGGASAAFGASYSTNDVISIAVDGRSAAQGSRSLGWRVYFAKNGTWQASGDPDAETGYVASVENAIGIAYGMFGGNATGQSGTVNLGGVAFAYTPPNDYDAPAWALTLLGRDFRDQYTSSVLLGQSYSFAEVSEALPVAQTSVGEPAYFGGIPTLLSRTADLAIETDRWCSLYPADRFFRTFDAFIPVTAADELEAGDETLLTYPRFNLTGGDAGRVVAIKGLLLEEQVTITDWG